MDNEKKKSTVMTNIEKLFSPINRLKEEKTTFEPFEKTNKIEPLLLYTIVVPYGQQSAITKIFKKYGVSAMFTTTGYSGWNRNIDQIVGLDSGKKNVIFAVVRQDITDSLKKDLLQRFSVSRASKGVAIGIKLSSIGGVAAYKFLSDSREVSK